MVTSKIRVDERVFICGKTGSGKTFLAKQLTREIERLVVCDSKGTLSDWALAPDSRESRRALMQGQPARLRMLPPLDLDDAATYWQDVFHLCFEAQNVTLYIDEMYSLVPPGERPPAILQAIWTRGREFHIGGWCATQRPTWVPLFTLSEAEHFFMFRLTLQDDRRRMATFMTDTVEMPIRDPHGFHYMSAVEDHPHYIPLYREGVKKNGV